MKQLHNIQLSVAQKRVLAKILASATPATADAEIIPTDQLVAARDLLIGLGAIERTGAGLVLSAAGTDLVVRSNIVDDTGQLTDLGQKLAYDDVVQESSMSLLRELLK